MAKELFFAQEGSLTIDSTDYSQQLKEIRISGGERTVNRVTTFGFGTYEQVNPVMDMMECTTTLRKKDSDLAVMHMGGKAVANYTGSAYEVYPYTPKTIEFIWTNLATGSEQLKIKLASAYATSREQSLGTDDHLEEVITWRCLPKYYIEGYTQDATGSALTI